MERILTQEERIRRAQELYNRKRDIGRVRVGAGTVNTSHKTDVEKQYVLLKKIVIQLLICLLIYFVFFVIQNSGAIFSEDFIDTTKQLLAYDIDFGSFYHQAADYFNSLVPNDNVKEDKPPDTEENNTDQEPGEGQGQENGETAENTEQENGILDEATLGVSDVAPDPIPLTQMEIDANEIKNTVSMIIPLKRRNYIQIRKQNSYCSNGSKISYWN